jgi:hypothetical protein
MPVDNNGWVIFIILAQISGMRKPVYYSLIFLLFSSISSGLSAQQDHVVLKNGDTLRGVVRNVGSNKMKFETTTTSMTLNNEEIELYYDSEKKETYCLRQIYGPARPVFITRLVDGPVRMFVYTVVQSASYPRMSTTTWFAETDSIRLGEIKAGGLRGGKDERRDFFRSLIADNPRLVKRFDADKKMKIEFLEELIREYNQEKADSDF